MRPGSAYRGSTARLSTAGFGPAPPTANRQPTAMTGFSMVNKKITYKTLYLKIFLLISNISQNWFI